MLFHDQLIIGTYGKISSINKKTGTTIWVTSLPGWYLFFQIFPRFFLICLSIFLTVLFIVAMI